VSGLHHSSAGKLLNAASAMTSFWTRANRRLQGVRQWYERTPERALDQAYEAALTIKAIEDEHFDGGKIANNSGKYSENTFTYFQSELKNYLKIAEIRLSEFKTSRSLLNTTDPSGSARNRVSGVNDRDRATVILEKLKFIDGIIDRYKETELTALSLVPVSQYNQSSEIARTEDLENAKAEIKGYRAGQTSNDDDSILDKTGVLPRSILGTLNRIKRDLDPNSERQVIQNFRTTKAKTLISIRFLLLLIIIPLLTQQISKVFIIGPIVDHFRKPENTELFLNFELEESALRELQTYEERLKFDSLIGRAPKLTDEQLETCQAGSETKPRAEKIAPQLSEVEIRECLVRIRADELALDYYRQGSNAIKNVFADLLSLVAFALVITTNRSEVAVLKTFIDETVYGLSDSAKAFIIILFTDMFVGFHSPHGWEVLLEGIAQHFGLPASRNFIFLFIATFPVILDTIFKYWIFRYLNRISPSAVATYRNMNE
jgi:hypothetical protein